MTNSKSQSISWQANGAAMSDQAKRHESAAPVNLTRTVYQYAKALQLAEIPEVLIRLPSWVFEQQNMQY
uniref:Uncharacterized protein n=1 Tax=uncultured bacterium B19D1_C12D4_E9D6 TaxID=1329637 RepID=S4W9Y2_9BACT|nr:hypothetical protein [uncultured bacterium B19D1_C12D4_E9D6]